MSACPYDTNGDGDCGRKICPTCHPELQPRRAKALMPERELLRELDRLRNLPPTVEDWRDLHETITAYRARCLGRAIARDPQRAAIVATLRQLAGLDPVDA